MTPVSLAEASAAIIRDVPVQPTLRLALADAIDHVLADDIVAAIPLPPWTNASMDGYAVRANDVRGARRDAPVTLRVQRSIAAGQVAGTPLGAGDAMRIYTGAPLPAGADSVIRQEDTDRGETRVAIFSDRDAGANVRAQGGDVARGSVALGRGTAIGPHQLAVLAALAVADPVVHRQPRVGVLAMGDEVVSLERSDDILATHKLADVNSPVLTALVRQAGGVPVPLGIAPDDADVLHAMVAAADDIDLLITAGGASVGDHDHVAAVMRRSGVRVVFDRVLVRPGGPTRFGLLADGRPWLALPGNPVSAMVTFDLFGRTAIRAMAGHRDVERRRFKVRMGDAVPRHATLDQYVRCTLEWSGDDGIPVAHLTGPQGSGMLMSVARADALAIVSHGEGICDSGAIVEASGW